MSNILRNATVHWRNPDTSVKMWDNE